MYHPLPFAAACLVMAASTVQASPAADAFIAGYAAAILERDLGLPHAVVVVQDGVVRLRAEDFAGAQRAVAIAALSAVRGVVRVEIGETEPPPPAALTASTSQAPAAAPGPALNSTVRVETAPQAAQVLPRGTLFEPLLADPRWPHFSAAFHGYQGDDELANAGTVSFGESFSLYRDALPGGSQWEIGFQAGVFAVFDLDAESMDLVNADYWVGIPVSYRDGRFSAISRIYHQSSHLGDEYLLRQSRERINLSYEALDLKLSYDLLDWLRVYGGAGYMFHREPADLEPWSTQLGLELRGTRRMLDSFRPVAAMDIQQRQESDWSADLSLRAGVQIESPRLISQRVQVLLEYFNGRSPNGQFYDSDIEYLGVGAHVFF